MYAIGLVLGAIRIMALCAVFAFLVLLWRRTGAFGFLVLAAGLVFAQVYPWLTTYARTFFPQEDFFYGSWITMLVGLIMTVVTACAWWNIYSRISRLMPNNSSKAMSHRDAP